MCSIIRQNKKIVFCQSTLLICIQIFASAYATSLSSCSIGWNCSLFFLLCSADPPIDTSGCAVYQLALHHEILTARWLHENFLVPFRLSLFSVFPRQGTYWESNIHAGRIIVHLKSVILHCSTTRFCYLQSGIKTPDDEYFGFCPLCLMFLFAVIMSDFNPSDHKETQLAFFLMKVFVNL